MTRAELIKKIWNEWKNAESVEAAIAYTNCYFWVLEYIKDDED